MSNINPLDGLYEIVGDLWADARQEAAREAAEKQAAKADKPETAVKPAAPEKEKQLPTFEAMWQTADETIDWTDYLSGTGSGLDGMSAERRAFLHEKAEAVLSGDLAAYRAVLQTIRPLDDLRPYAHHISVKAVSADTVQITFDALPEDARSAGTVYDAYLCGIALRSARDLFSVLPVTCVNVRCGSAESPDLTVAFSRKSVHNTLLRHIDPVEFVRRQGGQLRS